MNCSEVKELLSAYYDNALPSDDRNAVREHLHSCDDCARELDAFRSLSDVASHPAVPSPPAHLWQQIDEQLRGVSFQLAEGQVRAPDAQPAGGLWTRIRQAGSLPHVRYGLAMAVMVLIAVGLIGYRGRFDLGSQPPFAAVFGEYIDEFHRAPDAAQQLLLNSYKGEAVDAQLAVQTVGFRPLVAKGLPDGYTVDSTYVLQMPCCTCVQCLGRRSDGTALAIFEHCACVADGHEHASGDEAICDGVRCGLMDFDDRIAASWTRDDHHITVVGVRDTAEVERLVAWFDGS